MSKKFRVYFDYNVFNELTRCSNHNEYLVDIDVFYSVAHVEEFYKAYMNLPKEALLDHSDSNFTNLMKLKETILALSKAGVILNPTYNKIEAVPQSFDDCLNIVATYDTRAIIDIKGENLHNINNEAVAEKRSINKNVINYSNLSHEKIWETEEIIKLLDKFYSDYDKHKADSQDNLVIIYGRRRLRIKNTLPNSFELKKFCFKAGYYSFQLLELVIEILNNYLCKCGYNKDSDIRKTQSGIHDVSHMIYGTYCDYFVSNDRKMLKRAKAIYYYLGINTKAVTYDEFKNIVN